MAKDKAFFIGNGINNIWQTYSWSDLINNLIEYTGAKGQIDTRDKPFPLLYEEIFVEAIKYKNLDENQIKKFIANEVIWFQPNEIHEAIVQLNPKNIITTNYDFAFERLFTNNIHQIKNQGVIKETWYNIFRKYTAGNINFWHIHGDANSPASITLGYEHYSGYLQQMRNYVATGTGSSYKEKFEPVIKRLKTGITNKESWLDIFFTDDIYIIGLTLDFIEIHLWWLLTYRQRAKLTKNIPINNKIIYFYPSNIAGKIKNKIDLLRSNNVTPCSIKGNPDKADYYFEIIKKIENGI